MTGVTGAYGGGICGVEECYQLRRHIAARSCSIGIVNADIISVKAAAGMKATSWRHL